MDWKHAIPASFRLDEPGGKGRVYRGVTQGPPLQVREIPAKEFPSGKEAIVIEFQNEILETAREMGAEAVLTDGVDAERLVFHPRDARFLCAALIQVLADGGDSIAARLQDNLDTWDLEYFEQEED